MKLTWPFLSSLPLGRHAKTSSNSNVAFHLHYPGLAHVGKKSSKTRLEHVLAKSACAQWSQRMCVLAAYMRQLCSGCLAVSEVKQCREQSCLSFVIGM